MPVYQKIAPKIKELKALGMSNIAIANRLNINIKTVGKAIIF
jgi:DNA-binding CsgD family transcriptional regulator